MQLWPAKPNPPAATRETASATSAVSSTTTPALPPSSRMTRLRPARAFMLQPTSDDPVKVRSLKRASVTRRSPSARSIGTTLTAPSGSPASTRRCPRVSALNGVLLAGLSTIGFPAAMAGASLCATRLRGKLKGEMAATGPSGTRRVIATRPSPCGARSIGSHSPESRRASSAATSNVIVARSTSVRASRSGFPASPANVRATASFWATRPRATARRTSARRWAGRAAMAPAAETAASAAASYSASPASHVAPISAPSNGEETTSGRPVSTGAEPTMMGVGIGSTLVEKTVPTRNCRQEGEHCGEIALAARLRPASLGRCRIL